MSDGQPDPGKRGPFRRVLLKISGEALCEPGGFGFDKQAIDAACDQIAVAASMGGEVAVVIGGGNLMRGAQLAHLDLDRGTADYMGMMGTIINGLALQCALEKRELETRCLSAIATDEVVEPFIRRRAIRHLERKRIVILAGGTGAPFWSTDMAAALRARELACDVILKGTKVAGVYSKDPVKHADAEFLPNLQYKDVISRGLGVMDQTAITMCAEADMPIIVFDMMNSANLQRVLEGDAAVGTLISS